MGQWRISMIRRFTKRSQEVFCFLWNPFSEAKLGVGKPQRLKYPNGLGLFAPRPFETVEVSDRRSTCRLGRNSSPPTRGWVYLPWKQSFTSCMVLWIGCVRRVDARMLRIADDHGPVLMAQSTRAISSPGRMVPAIKTAP